jgi:molecular chaperone HtpG
MAWAHNQVEGNQSYTTLLYVPSRAPMDLLVNRDERHGLKLYVKRVFIMDAAEQLLPHYLRFVRGVVDSDDLPLNISREILQENPLVKSIRAGISKRILDTLKKLSKKNSEKYQQFWDEFGSVLKEGVVEDTGNKDNIAGLLRFSTSLDDKREQTSSLDHYIERMKDDQKVIYYITASSFETAKNSPHLEVFRKNGIEVLLMSDRVDEWMMGYFTEYQDLPFKSVAKGELDLGEPDSEQEDKTDDDEPKDDNELTGRIKSVLEAKVADVKVSQRLTESPACLVLGEHDMALHMQRLLEAAGQPLPPSKPSLEVNIDHPLLKRLEKQNDESVFSDWSELLFEQALLAEGGQLDDPAGFVRRLNKMIQEVAGES